jgi:hypothetical protein
VPEQSVPQATADVAAPKRGGMLREKSADLLPGERNQSVDALLQSTEHDDPARIGRGVRVAPPFTLRPAVVGRRVATVCVNAPARLPTGGRTGEGRTHRVCQSGRPDRSALSFFRLARRRARHENSAHAIVEAARVTRIVASDIAPAARVSLATSCVTIVPACVIARAAHDMKKTARHIPPSRTRVKCLYSRDRAAVDALGPTRERLRSGREPLVIGRLRMARVGAQYRARCARHRRSRERQVCTGARQRSTRARDRKTACVWPSWANPSYVSAKPVKFGPTRKCPLGWTTAGQEKDMRWGRRRRRA